MGLMMGFLRRILLSGNMFLRKALCWTGLSCFLLLSHYVFRKNNMKNVILKYCRRIYIADEPQKEE